ncbi:hypothetical protein D3C81_309260 [compost metagenome]
MKLKSAIIGLVAGMLIGSAGMAAAATSQTVQATLAKFTFSINGEKQALKSNPLIYKGTTYLPVREVAGLTGYELEYDAKAKSIDLTKGGTAMEVTSTSMTGRGLVELLAKKYPEVIKDDLTAISLNREGTLTFGDKKFTLTVSGNYVDVTPLIEAGIITEADIQ